MLVDPPPSPFVEILLFDLSFDSEFCLEHKGGQKFEGGDNELPIKGHRPLLINSVDPKHDREHRQPFLGSDLSLGRLGWRL